MQTQSPKGFVSLRRLQMLLPLALLMTCTGCNAAATPTPSSPTPTPVKLSESIEKHLDDLAKKAKGSVKLIDARGEDAGTYELGNLPEGTKSLIFAAGCDTEGGYRIFDPSDDAPYLLMTSCDTTAQVAYPVEKNIKSPIWIWSSGNYRLVVLASPEEGATNQ